MEAATSTSQADPVSRWWRVVDALIVLRRRGSGLGLSRFGTALLLLPALMLVGFLAVGLGILVSHSLHHYDTFTLEQGSTSTAQYTTVLGNSYFHTILWRTLRMAVFTTVATLALAVPFAVTMARTRRRSIRLLLLVIVFLPILTGDITRTYGWLVMLDAHGPIAWVVGKLGLGDFEVLGTLWAVGIGMVQVLLPIAILVLLPAVLMIDPDLEDAARTLGASPTRVFFRVTLPQLRVALSGAAAVCFALAMNEFANPALLGQGVRNYLGNYLYSTYLILPNPYRGAAVGVIMLVVIAVGAGLILAFGRLPEIRRARLARGQ
jgi:putative spermidine/putrescine transport system permease protein